MSAEYFLFISGFLTAETAVRVLEPNVFLEITFRSKKIVKKIHHYYFIPISLLFYSFGQHSVFWFIFGIGIHDVLNELWKILIKKFK